MKYILIATVLLSVTVLLLASKNDDAIETKILDGGFEKGFGAWDTAMRRPKDFEGNIDIACFMNNDHFHSGKFSLKISNNEPRRPELYATFAQLVDVKPRTSYVVKFWIKAEKAQSGTIFITCDPSWEKRGYIDDGSYDWKEFKHHIKTGTTKTIEVRFISEMPGTIYIDDITIEEVK